MWRKPSSHTRPAFSSWTGCFADLTISPSPCRFITVTRRELAVCIGLEKWLLKVGRHNVNAIASAEKGKTHTVLSCVSASSYMYVLPPVMVYPRNQSLPEKFKEGAIANTLFVKSENGGSTQIFFCNNSILFLALSPLPDLYCWSRMAMVHILTEVIELARDSNGRILCLPSHTTHILQLFDVGIFKSFKSIFLRACT